MNRRIVIEPIAALLIVLFVYTASSKLLDWKTFRGQMHNQPLPRSFTDILIWAIPILEIIASVLLAIKSGRLYGLYLSFLLMLTFTLYVAIIVVGVFSRIPCSCGGVFRNMSWHSHLILNVGLSFLALLGLIAERQRLKAS